MEEFLEEYLVKSLKKSCTAISGGISEIPWIYVVMSVGILGEISGELPEEIIKWIIGGSPRGILGRGPTWFIPGENSKENPGVISVFLKESQE